MIIRSDDAMTTGRDHSARGEICQDYALSGRVGPAGTFIAVSDGCSTGTRTDLGSRLLCLAARRWALVGFANTYEACLEHLRDDVTLQKRVLLLEDSDLFATCLLAMVRDDTVYVRAYGDGAMASEWRDGSRTLRRWEWSDNAPAYPLYGPDILARLACQGATLTTTTVTIPPPGVAGLETIVERSEVKMFDELFKGHCSGQTDCKSLKSLALFTDGVGQVRAPEGLLAWEDVVGSLLDFKTVEGDFAKRRLGGFLRGLRAKGGEVLDDLSMAALYFEDHDG